MRVCWFDQMSWMQDGDVWIVAVQDLKAVQGLGCHVGPSHRLRIDFEVLRERRQRPRTSYDAR